MSGRIDQVDAIVCLESSVHLPAKRMHKAFKWMNQDLNLRRIDNATAGLSMPIRFENRLRNRQIACWRIYLMQKHYLEKIHLKKPLI